MSDKKPPRKMRTGSAAISTDTQQDGAVNINKPVDTVTASEEVVEDTTWVCSKCMSTFIDDSCRLLECQNVQCGKRFCVECIGMLQ